MQTLNMEHARGSLARGLARQAMDEAARDDADTKSILEELLAMAPNARSRSRFAARLGGRRGVVMARAVTDGLVLVLRTRLSVDLHKDGIPCFTEDRIAWTRFHIRNAKGYMSYEIYGVHVTRHVLQRRVERSNCPLGDLLGDMDAAMLRALSRLSKGEILTDREDDYLPAARGVWAGGLEHASIDPDWGPAFGRGLTMPVFAIRTFLAEAEMRPTVWLGWSEARDGARAA